MWSGEGSWLNEPVEPKLKAFVQEARRVQEAEFSLGKSLSPLRGGLRFSVLGFRRIAERAIS